MEQGEYRSLSFEIHGLDKAIRHYLSITMPENARIATGGNAHIITFLSHNRDREIYQHDIEEHFCISPSTASRVLGLMEKKGLIIRESVDHDARLKRIVLTDAANSIVADLNANAARMEERLFEGFGQHEKEQYETLSRRLRKNIDDALNQAQRCEGDREQGNLMNTQYITESKEEER